MRATDRTVRLRAEAGARIRACFDAYCGARRPAVIADGPPIKPRPSTATMFMAGARARAGSPELRRA